MLELGVAPFLFGRYFLETELYSTDTGECLPALGPEGERLRDGRTELSEIGVGF